MRCISTVRHYAQSVAAALFFLVCTTAAFGADSYIGAGVLQIPTLGIGSATFSNVELSVNLPLVRGPNGSLAVGTEDAYDPQTNQLIVPAVKVGSTTYYNVVVTVNQLTSIESVSGADTFDGTNLVVRNVQVGAQSYHDVTLHVGLANVARLNGGMPSVSVDQFDAATGQLTIGAVLVGTKVYTNVILNVGLNNVVSVAGYAEGVLYSFPRGTNGAGPEDGLIMDASGKLYGTTYGGGDSAFGTVYKLTPNGSGGYTESVLYSFQGGADGAYPFANLIMDASGNLYGTTVGGDVATDYGTVFELTSTGNGGYTERVLYNFQGGANGDAPYATLIMDAGGNLYGTASGNESLTGYGTVFKLTSNGNDGFAESVLHSFQGGADGAYPFANLIMDASGNLYGTTNGGDSPNDNGTVFKLTSNGNSGYTESVLYSFQGGADGAGPFGGVVMDASGNLYGTTYGTAIAGDNDSVFGTVFKLTSKGNGGFTESVLYNFPGGPGGAYPEASLIMDAGGNLYGTTVGGDIDDNGTVFKLTPSGNGGYTESVLYSFQGGSDGGAPAASLFMDAGGNLYGTTIEGGSANWGVVFEIH